MKIATSLYYFGWFVLVVGGLASLIGAGSLDEFEYPLRWLYMIGGLFSSVTFGLVLLGISEIITQLHERNELAS